MDFDPKTTKLHNQFRLMSTWRNMASASDESEIVSFRAQIDRECVERFKSRHNVRCLENDLEHREGDVKELRVDAERHVIVIMNSREPTMIYL